MMDIRIVPKPPAAATGVGVYHLFEISPFTAASVISPGSHSCAARHKIYLVLHTDTHTHTHTLNPVTMPTLSHPSEVPKPSGYPAITLFAELIVIAAVLHSPLASQIERV